MKKQFRNRPERRPGLPPGTLDLPSKENAPVSITSIEYTDEQLETRELRSLADWKQKKDEGVISWLRIKNIRESHVVRDIGRLFNLHHLVLEDILTPVQRPKWNVYEDFIFIVLRIPAYAPETGELRESQVSLILGRDFLLTFQEDDTDFFSPISQRLHLKQGRIRRMQADYLTYTVLDLIVDLIFSVLETIEDEQDRLEELFMPPPGQSESIPEFSPQLFRLKRICIHLQKSVSPLREIIRGLKMQESELISSAVPVYLQDVYEHIIQISEFLDTTRETLTSLHDVYLVTISNRMNRVMKVLTVFASLFIPLTFLTSIYGMNFTYMPELDWPWAYPVLMGIMALATFGMLYYFRKKNWLGQRKKKK